MEVTEVKTVDLGNGQFFTFANRRQLGVAIAALSRAIADENLDRYESREYVDFETAHAVLEQHFGKVARPGTRHKTLSRRTSQLWAAMVAMGSTARLRSAPLKYNVVCAKCGPSPTRSQHDLYGVRHRPMCPVLKRPGYESYQIDRESIIKNAEAFATIRLDGIGPTTKESYQALVKYLRS